MPQFETAFYGAQIFWLLISFGFLYLMMSQLICPMLDETINDREHKIREILDRAEKFNREAMSYHQRYQTYMMDAEKEKNKKIQKAYQEINHKVNQAENKNELQLKGKIRRAESKINRTAQILNREASQLSEKLAYHLVQHLTNQEHPHELD